jgi:hypothetical protein
MGPDGIYSKSFLDTANEAVEGTYITFGGVSPSRLVGKGAAWYERYRSQFNSQPEAYGA